MLVIIIITTILFFILSEWTWHNLEDMKRIKKILYITFGILIMYLITLIVFNISKSQIQYNSKAGMIHIKNILVLVFSSINGLIVMPYVANIITKVQKNIISIKLLKINIIIIFIILILCLVIECNYLKNIQHGIINIYNLKSNK